MPHWTRDPRVVEWPTTGAARARWATSHDPIVYFLLVGEHVKIGTTNNRHTRFAAMVPPSAKLVLTLSGSIDLERQLHERFHADRVEGEWFRYSAQIKKFVEDNEATDARTSARGKRRTSPG